MPASHHHQPSMLTSTDSAPVTRREWLTATGGALAGVALGEMLLSDLLSAAERTPMPADNKRVRFCLNMSTIRGQKLPLPEQVEVAAKAGYDAVEPWLGDIQQFVEGGGKLADVRKRVADHGMTVESSIGFAPWIVDEADARQKGLDQLKRDMDWVAQLGGKRIAAPPIGMHQGDAPRVDLLQAADRYHAALEVGTQMNVTPMVELWGFSKNLSRLGEAVLVATESRHPQACVLADIYHMHKGGSEFEGLRLLSSQSMQVFHVNDYPASYTLDKLNDSHRVYPGDGDAPFAKIIPLLKSIGFSGVLSLELFNETYWKQDALLVAKTGLEKTKKVFADLL